MIRRGKRGPYQRRLHDPMFPELKHKTTTPEGRREYGCLYMRRIRNGGEKKK